MVTVMIKVIMTTNIDQYFTMSTASDRDMK